MIDAKHVHKLLECKYDFKHWIKDVISSFNFKDGIDYISYRYDNNGEQIIDNNSHVFRHDYYLFPKSILCIIYMKCDRSLFKDFIYDIIAYVNKDIESELHARFDIKGIYREWFNLSDCDLNDIIDKYKFKLCDMA